MFPQNRCASLSCNYSSILDFHRTCIHLVLGNSRVLRQNSPSTKERRLRLVPPVSGQEQIEFLILDGVPGWRLRGQGRRDRRQQGIGRRWRRRGQGLREGSRRKRRRRRRVANRCCWRLVLSRRSKRAVEHRQRSCDHVVLRAKFLMREENSTFSRVSARAKYSRNKDEENLDISYRILLQYHDENTEQVRASSINIDQSPAPFCSLRYKREACKMYYKIVHLFQRFALLHFAKCRCYVMNIVR